MNTIDVYMTFITPMDTIPEVLIAINRRVNELKVRLELTCFDIYQMHVKQIELSGGVDKDRVKVALSAYAMGKDPDAVSYLRKHFYSLLRKTLDDDGEGIYVGDNGSKVRSLSSMAEEFWRKKYGKSSGAGTSDDDNTLSIEDCADMAGLIEFAGIDIHCAAEDGDDEDEDNDDELPEATDLSLIHI